MTTQLLRQTLAVKLVDRRSSRGLARPLLVLRSSMLVLVGGLVALAVSASPALAEFGLQRVAISARTAEGALAVQAGAHPYSLTTTLVFNQPPLEEPPEGNPKDVRVELPPGLVGNPTATPRCGYAVFLLKECSNESAIGVATTYAVSNYPNNEFSAFTDPVYNLVPPGGVAAEFAYLAAGDTPVLLASTVRTGADYGVTVNAQDVNEALVIGASKVTLWGVPADERHDPWRGNCEKKNSFAGGQPLETPGKGLSVGEFELEGPMYEQGEPSPLGGGMPESLGECHSGAPELPLLTNPVACGRPLAASVSADSWQEQGKFHTDKVNMPEMEGCGKLGFSSTVTAAPEKSSASTASGLSVDVKVPQGGTESPVGLAEGDVNSSTVVLPEGVAVNPSSADGLAACSPAQIGFTGSKELEPEAEPGVSTPQFTPRLTNPATGREEATLCPDASKIANVKIKTPLLSGELEGSVYLASPQNFAGGTLENPFGSLIAMYLVAEEPATGVLVKLPGKVTQDPITGRLTTSFQNTPQVPFSDLHLEFYGGERAPLVTPAHCGTYTTEASFTPWSATSQFATFASFPITTGAGGSGCPGGTLGFSPSLQAGTTTVNAGSFSSISTSIAREDGQQALKSVQVTFPPGVSAVLTGVPECAEAQANAGSCPAESQIGESTASAGVANDPFSIKGKVYLTGPYQGAPFGLSIVTPPVAGPFTLDEGAPVVVRAKLEINPATAQVTATTGEIPHILDGIPLQLKHVNVLINRPSFAINPTSCAHMTLTGTIDGLEGAASPFATPFQVADCANLAFHPNFTASTQGNGTTKGHGASLDVKIGYPGPFTSYANIAKTDVSLPYALSSRLTTLQKACTETQFATNPAGCPPASNVGTAMASTPILPLPLEGPAYLVSHGGRAFPDLDIILQGDNVKILLTGNTQIKNGITNTKFETVPDDPVSSFELKLPEKENALLGAIKNLCAPTKTVTTSRKETKLVRGKRRKVTVKVKTTEPEALIMPTELTAQNGAVIKQSTKLAVTGCAKPKPTAKSAAKKKAKSAKSTRRGN